MLIQCVTLVWLKTFDYMPEVLCYLKWQETDMSSALISRPETEFFQSADTYFFKKSLYIYTHSFIFSISLVYFIYQELVMRITKLTETFSMFRSQFQSTVKHILNKKILCAAYDRLLASLKIYLWPQDYINSLRN